MDSTVESRPEPLVKLVLLIELRMQVVLQFLFMEIRQKCALYHTGKRRNEHQF